ncbi:futalosine hydrolase [Salipaludibacillus sp. LMS25]|jgi:futalosine hydrolase|uniref:futalosine hydrolase n=1 Tax=Salipaludibacillus sp. LMS25 TaxID=2924031 RepID=UPI0020D0D537|nr:futalosine hydrolase [Salipaludibacillus sp. LMS25]UTR13297.1 futalosine hydrolase [Salipaludibacillus sp. LMS25]
MEQLAKHVLIVTSVDAEKTAILSGIQDRQTLEIDVHTVGVGSVAAAVNTANLLAKHSYDMVINMGVAGGFPSKAEIGDAVIATDITAADLGAESDDGFKPIEELGFGQSVLRSDNVLSERLTQGLKARCTFSIHRGPVVTLSTVTGTAKTLTELEKRVQGVVAEAMEGFGVATAATSANIPFLEIRTISNMVGPRDKSAWRLDVALHSLEHVSKHLKEVL